METKPCIRCKETRALSDFYRSSVYISGRRSMCKYCCREAVRISRIKQRDIRLRPLKEKIMSLAEKTKHHFSSREMAITLGREDIEKKGYYLSKILHELFKEGLLKRRKFHRVYLYSLHKENINRRKKKYLDGLISVQDTGNELLKEQIAWQNSIRSQITERAALKALLKDRL